MLGVRFSIRLSVFLKPRQARMHARNQVDFWARKSGSRFRVPGLTPSDAVVCWDATSVFVRQGTEDSYDYSKRVLTLFVVEGAR
jgi:hypothetical protein